MSTTLTTLQAAVDAQAAAVRELKTNKAPAETVQAAVAVLLDAKARLKEATEVRDAAARGWFRN